MLCCLKKGLSSWLPRLAAPLCARFPLAPPCPVLLRLTHSLLSGGKQGGVERDGSGTCPRHRNAFVSSTSSSNLQIE